MIRVLVVDDQPLIRKAITSILRDDPTLTVIGEAVNGREAIDQCLSAPPDVVLMDIRMPGLDGLEVSRFIRVEEARAGLAPTRIVAVTANAFAEDRQACRAAGIDDFVTKPVDLEALGRLVAATPRAAAPDALAS